MKKVNIENWQKQYVLNILFEARHCPKLSYIFLKLIPIQPPLSTHLHTHTQLHRHTFIHKISNIEMESSAKIYFLFPF